MHLRARKPQFDLKNTLHSKYAYKLAVAMAPHTLLVPNQMGPAAAAALLAREGGASLLDVRQPGEYRLDGHVDGSVNIPAYT